ncbi:MAG: ABC transporter substrate-binding protein [Armatimonadetes bacterium]|nr:ABC transporter substrate-binding protein [Armatimonadota bacterium]
MTRLDARRAVAAVVALAVLAAAGGAGQAAPVAPRLPDIPVPKVSEGGPGIRGGTLVVSTISDPKTFNVVVAQETSSSAAVGPVFEGLVEEHGETTEVEPAMAESWSVSPDGRTWTFNLRQGIKWFDGKPFTADDVVFTFDALYDPKVINSFADVLTMGGKKIAYKKVDAHTVQFITPTPFGPFLRTIGIPIIPRHKLEAAYKAGKFMQTWGVNTPPREIVGTGPFMLTKYEPAQRLTYERNPNYWRVSKAGTRLPYLDRMVRLIVPNVETARLKFQAGETDVYGIRGREFSAFKRDAARGNYSVYEGGPGFGIEFITFNQNPRGAKPPKLGWFSNVKFRQAVAHAIDRQRLINQVHAGRAVPQYGPESPANKLFFNPNTRQYPYDPKRAEALLKETGLSRGQDGKLRDAQSNPVEFELNTSAGSSDAEATSRIIKDNLEALGMKVNFLPRDFNLLVSKLDASFDWDAIYIGLTGGVDPHNGRNVYHSTGSLHFWNPRQKQPATPWEAEMDRVFDGAASTVDQARRRQRYNRYQEIIAEQLPVIPTVQSLGQTAVRNTLGNIRYTNYGGALWNIWDIYRKR